MWNAAVLLSAGLNDWWFRLRSSCAAFSELAKRSWVASRGYRPGDGTVCFRVQTVFRDWADMLALVPVCSCAGFDSWRLRRRLWSSCEAFGSQNGLKYYGPWIQEALERTSQCSVEPEGTAVSEANQQRSWHERLAPVVML